MVRLTIDRVARMYKEVFEFTFHYGQINYLGTFIQEMRQSQDLHSTMVRLTMELNHTPMQPIYKFTFHYGQINYT